MNPEELDAELNRLWSKVASGSYETPLEPNFISSDTASLSVSRVAAVEALALVKRQYRESKKRWDKMMKGKEEAIQELSQALRRAEAEVLELRRQTQRFEIRLVSEVAAVVEKLEASQKLLRMQEERFSKEEKRLVETLDQVHSQNRRLKESESFLLSESEGLRSQLSEVRASYQRLEKEAGGLQAAIRQAREAVAGTVAELVLERQSREKAEEELAQARVQLKEQNARIARMEKIWDEERAQWQELLRREQTLRGS